MGDASKQKARTDVLIQRKSTMQIPTSVNISPTRKFCIAAARFSQRAIDLMAINDRLERLRSGWCEKNYRRSTMKKVIMLAGVAAPLASRALAQAPSGSYGTGNIVFPNDPAAAAAAGAYSTMVPGSDGGAFAYVPAPARGDCAQRFKSYDPRSGTYLGKDGRRHICR